MSSRIVAVIGHVDHGKTTLVKALTGIETDRLTEEHARGLSIALGFAHLELNDAVCYLVDTPGHADFVRTTASGLSGADAILLVVSSLDGVAVQTREYLEMACLFGLSNCVVALSQSDRASPTQIEATESAVKTLLFEHDMTASTIMSCSAVTGENIERLRASLIRFSEAPLSEARPVQNYLPIDRVFSVAGAGTVVTGSLIGGRLETDCDVCVTPANKIVSVRALQVAGQDRAIVASGSRVAVNLRGLDPDEVDTGDVLCGVHFHAPSKLLDVALTPPSKIRSKLKHMEQIQLLIGTRAISAKVRLFGRSTHETDSALSFAQLDMARSHVAYRGQRAVIRRPASGELVAGAIVLDPEASTVVRNKARHLAVLKAAFDRSPIKVAEALASRDHGCVDITELERLSGYPVSSIHQDLSAQFNFDEGPFAFDRDAQAALEDLMLEALGRLHMDRPLRPYVSKQDLQQAVRHPSAPLALAAQLALKERGVLCEQGSNVWLTSLADMDAVSADVQSRLVVAEAALRARGMAPKIAQSENVEDQEETDIEDRLIWMGRAVRLYNIGLKQSVLLHTEVVTSACMTLRQTFGETEAFTTGAARQVLRTNRKTIVPLLEHFDRLGVTRRRGNLRWMVACSRPE